MNAASYKVSVIVPVYNVEQYLRRCLDSIVNQTLRDIEIIIVDDGSTDEGPAILKEYAEKDGRITILTQPNMGLSIARNNGLKCAHAEYIGFVDSDDYIDSEMFQKLYTIITSENVDLVHCGTNIIYQDMEETFLSADERYFEHKYKGKMNRNDDFFGSVDVGVWNKLYKTKLIRDNGISFPEYLANEDAYFFWCYLSITNSVYFTSEKYYYYIRRPNSIMEKVLNKKYGLKVLDHLKVGELYYEFLIKHNLYEKQKYAFWNCYLICYWYIFSNATPAIIIDHGIPMIRNFFKAKDISFLLDNKFNGLVPGKKVSIILPIYNVEPFLRRCIDSVLTQTYLNIEVILATDGPESCDEICREYAEKDSRVKVLFHPGSYGKAFNKALELASGDYIGIVETDDWCDHFMFQNLYTRAIETGADITKCYFYDAHDGFSEQRVTYDGFPDILNINDCPEYLSIQPAVWSAIYRKDFLIKNNLKMIEDRISYIDAGFHVETAVKANKIALLKFPLYYYYQDNPQASVKNYTLRLKDAVTTDRFTFERIKDIIKTNSMVNQGFTLATICHLMWNYSQIKENKLQEFWKYARKYLQYYNSTINADFSLCSNEHQLFYHGLIMYNTYKKYKSSSNRITFRQWIFKKFHGFLYCWEEKGLVYTSKLLIKKCLRKPRKVIRGIIKR